MALVHFIWWGAFRGDDSVAMPLAAARACPGHEFWLWCSNDHRAGFAQALQAAPENLTLKHPASVREIVGDALADGADRAWYAEAGEALLALETFGAWAACKDLLSLLILLRHGGYYLDTTTLFPPDDAQGAALNAALGRAAPDAPRVVGLDDQTWHTVGLQSATAIVSGFDMSVEEGIQLVQRIDVWAMYTPALHPAVELAVLSYVSRCNRMGVTPDMVPANFESRAGADILKDKQSGREDLLGNLIIGAVYDGLLEKCCDARGENLAPLLWPATRMKGAEKRYSLPALGIHKLHAGIWRELDAPVQEERKQQ